MYPYWSDIIQKEQSMLLHRSQYFVMLEIILFRHYRRTADFRGDILELLRHFSKNEASDPRDKIYALIGLAGAENFIIPDYSQPVEELYKGFVRSMIERQQSLRVIYAAEAGTTNLLRLPSWVPDWNNHHAPNSSKAPIGLAEKARAWYHAAGNTESDFRFSNSGDILYVRGTVCDRVSLLASQRIFDADSDSETGKRSWRSFIFGSGDPTYPTGIPQLQAFSRTALIDFDILIEDRLQTKNSSFFDLASAFLCRLGYNLEGDFLMIQKPNGECDYIAGLLKFLGETRDGRSSQALLEFFLGASTKHLTEQWTNGDLWRGHHSCSAFIGFSTSITADRRLFRTQRGYMGLAPRASCEGDLVCVLLGSSVPVILQKFESHYLLIGECFALGFMDGEALKDVENGETVLEEFSIH